MDNRIRGGEGVDYAEYLELKFQLTSELKILTENINRLTQFVEKKVEEHDGRLLEIEKSTKAVTVTQGPVASKTETASMPSNIKWLIILILGIAFLGALGAAIGINLLGYLTISGTP